MQRVRLFDQLDLSTAYHLSLDPDTREVLNRFGAFRLSVQSVERRLTDLEREYDKRADMITEQSASVNTDALPRMDGRIWAKEEEIVSADQYLRRLVGILLEEARQPSHANDTLTPRDKLA